VRGVVGYLKGAGDVLLEMYSKCKDMGNNFSRHTQIHHGKELISKLFTPVYSYNVLAILKPLKKVEI